MNFSITKANVWPPFDLDHLPLYAKNLANDWSNAPLQEHYSTRDQTLVSIVIPCFNPDPKQFAQLLLSIKQQTDQNFDVLLVNDGSEAYIWSEIEKQIKYFSWIKTINQEKNCGISSTLNLAIDNIKTPYIALLDQDDLLHPAAIDFINQTIIKSPLCKLIYTDHIVFYQENNIANYIPKFKWNSYALLEFNFLIHLTVINVDSYKLCGGMDSKYDGIQDWEFYLRISSLLKLEQIIYLPLPLYAWRISEFSTASSAKPKKELVEKIKHSLEISHSQIGEGTKPLIEYINGEIANYRFYVDRSNIPSSLFNILVIVNSSNHILLKSSINSFLKLRTQIDNIYIMSVDSLPLNIIQDLSIDGIKIKYINPNEVNNIGNDKPLFTIISGAKINHERFDMSLIYWLNLTTKFNILTLPCFTIADKKCCISAGYSALSSGLNIYLPHAKGLLESEYTNNFSSFAHTRLIDLPSPAIQILSPKILRAFLQNFSTLIDQGIDIYDSWFSSFADKKYTIACVSESFIYLDDLLFEIEDNKFFKLEEKILVRSDLYDWMQDKENLKYLSYGYWVSSKFSLFKSNHHPLYLQEFLNKADILPGQRYLMEKSFGKLSLLPELQSSNLVILIPTELNPRSNGHACMLTLAINLKNSGRNIYLLPFKPYKFFRDYFPNLDHVYRDLPFISSPEEVENAVLILPESTPISLVKILRPKFKKLIWWLLAPAGLLTDFFPDIRLGDYLVPFSEFALPAQNDYLFIHPKTHSYMSEFMNQYHPQPSNNKQILLYTGKGRIKSLPRSLHRFLLNYKIILITRSYPKSKGELIELMKNSNGIISFDSMTNLNLEAANMGLPVFLAANPFPSRCYANFPEDLRPFISDSPGIFIKKLLSKSSLISMGSLKLYRKSQASISIIDKLTSFPEPISAFAYVVSKDKLLEIKKYRNILIRTRTIQTSSDGQSLSAGFISLYLKGLKYPYYIHISISLLMQTIDIIADILSILKLLKLSKIIFTLTRLNRLIAGIYRKFFKVLNIKI